jgi:molybdopterin-guanine dinucleotide biosynthesis protein A
MSGAAGFVLAGGRSSRMGRDKALLPWHGRTLLEQVAEVVRQAAGDVTVIGHESYRSLGLRVIPDAIPDRGPLGGLLTALDASDADRVLLVACDMPEVTVGLLTGLLSGEADAVVAEAEGRLHPLCAVYHRRVLPKVNAAIRGRSLKMHDFLSHIAVQRWPVSDAKLLINMNTPEDMPA